MTGFASGFLILLSKRQPKQFFINISRTASRARTAASAAAFVVAVALVGMTSAAHAQSTSLLTNGNFESGTFAGWTVNNVRDATDVNATRNFYIDTPGTTTPPVSNSAGNSYFFNTAQNTQPGGGGNYYAVTTSDAPGQSALLQGFTTPTIRSGQWLRLTFTFDLFVNDQSGYSNQFPDPSGLDYTSGGTGNLNQYARVDLLRFSSSDFSTSASDVLFNVPLNVPLNDAPNDNPNPYQRYSVDLSPYVSAGAQYKIRFAEVDNSGATLNLGVDNVGIQADITPEPSTLALVLPLAGFAPAVLVHVVRSRHRARRRAAKKV